MIPLAVRPQSKRYAWAVSYLTASALLFGACRPTFNRSYAAVETSPSILAFATEPSSTAIAGQAFQVQPVVVVQSLKTKALKSDAQATPISLYPYLDPACTVPFAATNNTSLGSATPVAGT